MDTSSNSFIFNFVQESAAAFSSHLGLKLDLLKNIIGAAL